MAVMANIIKINSPEIKEIDLDSVYTPYSYLGIYSHLFYIKNYSVENYIYHTEMCNMISELNRLYLHKNFKVTNQDLKSQFAVVTKEAKSVNEYLPYSPANLEEKISRADHCKDLVRDILERFKTIAETDSNSELINYINTELAKFSKKSYSNEIKLLTALRNVYAHQTRLTDSSLTVVVLDSTHTADFTNKVFELKKETKDSLILEFRNFDLSANTLEKAMSYEYFKISKLEIDNAIRSLYFMLVNLNKELKKYIQKSDIQIAFTYANGKMPPNMIYSVLAEVGLTQTIRKYQESEEYKHETNL